MPENTKAQGSELSDQLSAHWNALAAVATTRESCVAITAIQEHLCEVEKALATYATHDSWRCAFYSECHCGLNDFTDRLGVPRIPFEVTEDIHSHDS